METTLNRGIPLVFNAQMRAHHLFTYNKLKVIAVRTYCSSIIGEWRLLMIEVVFSLMKTKRG